MLPELKQAERPHLAALVERRSELGAALARREAELGRRGFEPQVAPQPDASPLFLVRGRERRRIEWRPDGRWGLRGAEGAWPIEELAATIADNPAAVSPGVLARPAIQDAVLGTSLFLIGPGELAYLAQAGAAHEVLGLAAPEVALRPHALALDLRAREQLTELGSSLEELLGRPEAITDRLAARAGGGFVEPARARVAALLAELEAPALALDPTLAKPFEKTRESVERAFETFAGKVSAAATRRDELALRRFEQLRQLAAPGGKPQERQLASAWFAGRWGESFGSRLLDALDLDPRHLSVVDPA
jgi:uncharacterized protein YllA (UPF0747 family)